MCVVLADVRMPRMDGWDLQRELRRVNPELPVVLVTADRLLAIRGSVRDKPMAPGRDRGPGAGQLSAHAANLTVRFPYPSR